MNNRLTAREREHLARVKALPCSVCGFDGPSEAHHIKQGAQYTCIALCESCHRGAFMGIHGQRRGWIMAKMDELDALNVTIERIINEH